MAEEGIICPACGATTYYHYGRASNGKERYLCLMCNRQFIAREASVKSRPLCPVCKQPMHVYKRQTDAVRYRCGNYPECRHFLKVENKKE